MATPTIEYTRRKLYAEQIELDRANDTTNYTDPLTGTQMTLNALEADDIKLSLGTETATGYSSIDNAIFALKNGVDAAMPHTHSNVAGGTGLFYQQTGTDTQFYSLVAGQNISITGGIGGANITIGVTGFSIGTDVQAYDASLTSLAALATTADKMVYTTAVDTYAETPISAFGRGLVNETDAASLRATLGLVVGADIQPYDADLDALSALSTQTWGRGLLIQINEAAFKAYANLEVGVDVQAYNANLSAFAGLADAAGYLYNDGLGGLSYQNPVGTGDIADGGNSTGATVRIGTNDNQSLVLETNNTTALEIDSSQNVSFSGSIIGNLTGNCSGTSTTVTGATQAAIITCSNLATVGTITTGVWQGTNVEVEHGGTGNSSATPYAVLCGGTTSIGALQSVAGGSSGQVLTYNGTGALPTWQNAASGYWIQSTNNIYYNTGNVGVGSISPSSGKLQIEVTDSTTCIYSTSSDPNGKSLFANNTNSSFYGAVLQLNSDRTASGAYNLIYAGSGGLADIEFRVDGTGQIYSDAGTSVSSPADYADMMEWLDGNPNNEDRVGYTVVMQDGKIRKANSNDDESIIIGVVSGNPTICGNTAHNRWKDKFLKDEFNRYIPGQRQVTEWTLGEGGKKSYYSDSIPEDVEVPEYAIKKLQDEARILNPDYDPDVEYIPRSKRREWDAVGLIGILPIRKNQIIKSNWIFMRKISENVDEYLVR